LDISVLSSFMKSVVLMPDDGFTVVTAWLAAEEPLEETGDVADMGGVGSGKGAQMRGSAKGCRRGDRADIGGFKSGGIGLSGAPGGRAPLPVLFTSPIAGAAFGK